jgi:hypothetical protein
MIEGSGSGKPKNIWLQLIRIRIRIRNTAVRNYVHKTPYAIKLELFNLSEVYLLMTLKRSALDVGHSSLSLGSGSTTLGSGGDRKGRRPDIEIWDAANTFAGTATVESTRAGGGGADSADRSSTAGTQSPESCSSAVADGERCHSPG